MVVGDQSFGWIGEVPVEVRRLAASASVGLGSSGMGLTLAPSPTALIVGNGGGLDAQAAKHGVREPAAEELDGVAVDASAEESSGTARTERARR